MTDELIYIIPPECRNVKELKKLLTAHPEIKFVSMVGVDLGGNDTDEKIPISNFLKDPDKFLTGGVQTDGSSVVLPGIATLNNGKVDFEADHSVNWFIDYNFEHLDSSGKPIGTLRIPSFLIHSGKRIDSRSILLRAMERVKKEVPELLRANPEFAEAYGFKADEIQDVTLTSATELEFWVKTPNEKAEIEQLTVSQVLQEQYWKRTKGVVRTALEHSLLLLEKYGLEPEMGHKEVGGIKAQITQDGGLTHVMEQLEIDWKYAEALQAADNELVARIIIKETFRRHGLEVTFMAKPMEEIAGNGEHTHVGLAIRLKDGTVRNLFSPANPGKDYLSPLGWGALMGILKNYEVIGTFITASNDAFNRLKPGFEAPVCIVASVGHDVNTPSRNRTVLVGLIRETDNPLATRFEVRAPNPHTNTYLALAALYQGIMDGINHVVREKRASAELEREFSKAAGETGKYLETDRMYRSEEDVFHAYGQEERNKLFGTPPSTVWEAIDNLQKYAEKTWVLMQGDIFDSKIIQSYSLAMLNQWVMELKDRILPENMEVIRSLRLLDDGEVTALDEARAEKIQGLKRELMKDRPESLSLFTQLRQAIDDKNYPEVSRLQLVIAEKMQILKKLYAEYRRNFF
ncbi:MAG TPA: glutamine synthetase [Firmicutes bacterium]|nr:glutamine synthetase [Bacillota bacterium]